jgi:tetratricopeptide (TPR) repeat protein
MSKRNPDKEKPILNINLRVFVYIGLIFLLFYPPFLRGLFFPPELLMTHMFTAVLFALCWYDKILRKDVTFLKGPLDYFALAFVFVYVFSLFDAVNMRGAVGELLKVINYFMVYWIAKETVKSEKDIKALLRAIFFSAVGVAVVGIGAAMGVIDYPGAVVGNRIYSTLQYPNTTATFLALSTFLGFGLINTSQNKAGKIVYSVGNMLLMAVIVASQSRGSWFLYPLVMMMFFVGLPKQYRFFSFYNLAVCLGVGLQVARVIQHTLETGPGLDVLKWLILGAAGVSIAQWIYDLIIDWMERQDVRVRTRKLLGAGVVAYAVVVLLVYIAYSAQAVPSVAAMFAPTDALQRVNTINNQQTSYVARLDMTKTAFRMALDYPLNGLGGEGWNALYHRYQPYLMFSSETHNYPAKVLVETGFIGLFALMVIWFFNLKGLYKSWRAELDENTWTLVWACGIAAITLGAHSIYDFDLSMGAMGIILWCLWGVIRGSVNINVANVPEKIISLRKMLSVVLAGTVGAAVLFAPSASLYAAGTAGAEGAKAMAKKNWADAEQKLSKAVRLDPLTASYSADLVQVYTIMGMGGKDSSKLDLAEKYADQAVRMEPYNYQVRLRLLLVSLVSGRLEDAVDDAESLVANNPLDAHNFEILGKVYIAAGRYLASSGEKEKARTYWHKINDLRPQLEEKEKLVKEAKSWQGDPPQITSIIQLYEGEAACLLGDYTKALSILNNLDEKQLPEPLRLEKTIYLAVAKEKDGQKKDTNKEISRLFKTNPGLSQEFNEIIKISP